MTIFEQNDTLILLKSIMLSNFDFRYPISTSNMAKDKKWREKEVEKWLKQGSIAYKGYCEKDNAKKRNFLNKMTPEQKEMKRLKDREYYQRKKAENKVKTVGDMTKREKSK